MGGNHHQLEQLLMTNRHSYTCYTFEKRGWARYSAKRSRYQTGKCIAEVGSVRPPRFLGESDDPQARQAAADALAKNEAVLNEKRQSFDQVVCHNQILLCSPSTRITDKTRLSAHLTRLLSLPPPSDSEETSSRRRGVAATSPAEEIAPG